MAPHNDRGAPGWHISLKKKFSGDTFDGGAGTDAGSLGSVPAMDSSKLVNPSLIKSVAYLELVRHAVAVIVDIHVIRDTVIVEVRERGGNP